MRPVVVAKLLRPHGVRGVLVARVFCEDPTSLANYAPFFTETGDPFPLTVLHFPQPNRALVRVAGCDDRTAAEAWRNKLVLADRALFPPTEPGTFYHCDLIGLMVADAEDRTPFGRINAVQDLGAGTFLEILPNGGTPDTPKLWTIPFTEEAIKDVDINTGIVLAYRRYLL